jgi:light-regulated signal transduction histidine kinase (bacteriophytochrome)
LAHCFFVVQSLLAIRRCSQLLDDRFRGICVISVESTSTAANAVDLTSCDREQIQHINSIQPIGFLLALSLDWQVSHASANIEDFLGVPVDALRGAHLRDLIRADAIHAIRNRLSILNGADGVERSFGMQLQDDGPLYDLAIYRSQDLIIVEAEPNIACGDLNAGAMVRSMLVRIKGQASLMPEAARLMQALTGFDRVMIYRFHPDGSGEVIAERVRGGLEPFLGLRYPAGDIPRQARALLVRNPVRILVDVDAAPVALVPLYDTPAVPLDLSMSTLRAHSAMHIEFLTNMGVGATMTVGADLVSSPDPTACKLRTAHVGRIVRRDPVVDDRKARACRCRRLRGAHAAPPPATDRRGG